MKKPVPSNSRSSNHFSKGARAFILDGEKGKTGLLEQVACYEKHGKFYYPASFVGVVITTDGDGCYEFTADQNLSWGSSTGSIGSANPYMLRNDEIEWLKQAIRDFGTADYKAIEKLAQDGNDAALTIVGYCQSSYWCILFHRFNARREEDLPRAFHPQQFLDAIEELARQPV